MSLETLNLAQLLARVAQGDHACFAEVYARTHAHLFGVAHRMLGHEQAAEDALQEAFVSIWKSASTYQTTVNGQPILPMTWLISIVRNKALDALRVRTRRKESALPEADDASEAAQALSASLAPSALDLFTQAAQALQVQACLEALSASHRQSLALAYYQGLSNTEVAAQMGAPLGSVKAWIRRGLDKLKSCLAAQGARA